MAQGLARFVDIEEVTGSNPVLPTTDTAMRSGDRHTIRYGAPSNDRASPFAPTNREKSFLEFSRLRAKAGARSCWQPVLGEKTSRWLWKRKFEPTRLAKIAKSSPLFFARSILQILKLLQ